MHNNIDFDDRRPTTTSEDEPRIIDDEFLAHDREIEDDRRRALQERG